MVLQGASAHARRAASWGKWGCRISLMSHGPTFPSPFRVYSLVPTDLEPMAAPRLGGQWKRDPVYLVCTRSRLEGLFPIQSS